MVAALGTLVAAPLADAATFRVDDDGAQCPAAPYKSIQAAIDAASPGDTVTICPGTYVEGAGTPGSNALTVTKSLTLKGAGADLVKLRPVANAQLIEAAQNIRNGVGDIISVVGTPSTPIKVDISGITIDGNGAFVEAGVVYLDATGTFFRNRVTNVVTSELAADEDKPGGYRGPQFGYGVAQVTGNTTAPAGATQRTLTVSQSRVDRYNRVGVLIDSATNDTAPYTRSGIWNRGVLTSNSVVGRLLCTNMGANGNCTASGSPGNNLITTGRLFGQDGVRATAGSSISLTGNTISQNLVNGTGAPTRGQAGNNLNLDKSAGIRLIGAQASSATRNNIVDNAYGVHNTELDGTTANESVPLAAENNWWGLRVGTSPLPNPGPAISPITNPPFPENPVNGFAAQDGTGTTSTAVDFFPHRNGAQGDGQSGEFTVFDAPLPMVDAAPLASLASDKSVAKLKDTVTLTALASDDFGVNNVQFFDGAEELATDSLPPYTHTLTVPEGTPCSEHALTAVVEDSLGQTVSDTVALTIDCNATAETPTQPSPPGKPTLPGSLPNVGKNGALVRVSPVAPAGIGSVDFFLGSRKVCTRTAAPFECQITPTGADVGTQALRVVLTDALGQTAELSRAVQIQRFKVRSISWDVDRLRTTSKTKGWKVTGTLKMASVVTPAQGCDSGRVTLVLKRAGSILADQQVSLRDDCTFAKNIRVPRRGTYQLTARFGGNAVLLPASANRRLS